MAAEVLQVSVNAEEYCLFAINWWVTCLTKSEWASWVQAFGVGVALIFPLISKFISRRRALSLGIGVVNDVRHNLRELQTAIRGIGNENYCPDLHKVFECVRTINVKNARPEYLSALSVYDVNLMMRSILSVEELEQAIKDCFDYGQDSELFGFEMTKSLVVDRLTLEYDNLKNFEEVLSELYLTVNVKKIFPEISISDRIIYFWKRIKL